LGLAAVVALSSQGLAARSPVLGRAVVAAPVLDPAAPAPQSRGSVSGRLRPGVGPSLGYWVYAEVPYLSVTVVPRPDLGGLAVPGYRPETEAAAYIRLRKLGQGAARVNKLHIDLQL
jgi:hypothetical protein